MAKLTLAQIQHIHLLAAKMCQGTAEYVTSSSKLSIHEYPGVMNPRGELNRYLKSIDIKEQKDD